MITYYVTGASGHLGHNVIFSIKSYHQLHQIEDYRIVIFSLPNELLFFLYQMINIWTLTNS